MATTLYLYGNENSLTDTDSTDKGLVGYSVYLRLKITFNGDQVTFQNQILGKSGMVRENYNFYKIWINADNFSGFAWSYDDSSSVWGHGYAVSNGAGIAHQTTGDPHNSSTIGTIVGAVNTWTDWYGCKTVTIKNTYSFEWQWGNVYFNSGSVTMDRVINPANNPEGMTYIYDGTTWKPARPYIYNGTEWKPAMAQIHNGTSFVYTKAY